MSDTMSIEEYLAQGGVLTSPANVPPRYRGELLRMMGSFVDSELAGSAGFADMINAAPGIKERIAAARIVLEKTDHAERVLKVMEEFGADVARYAVHYPWGAKVEREVDIGDARYGKDMRLSVFHYPLRGWVDAVVMNVSMGLAVGTQLQELARVSYAPLADAFRAIAPREASHTRLGLEGLRKICGSEEGRRAAAHSVAFWRAHVAATFGSAGSTRFEILKKFGLRHEPNETLRAAWETEVDRMLAELQLG
jgi:ring-1,2-phenylacetyl-CoA epoxidase subunit PaaA